MSLEPRVRLTPKQLRQLKAAEPVNGNRIGAAMQIANVDQAAVADGTDLSQPYISDVKRGRWSTISVANAHKFARFFGVSIDVLFPAPVVSSRVA